MKRALVAGVLVLAAAALARAQTFDVAAIKQNKSGEANGAFGGPASRFTATNVPALQFILYALRVQDFQNEGAPDWVKTDRWDINAKADGNFPATTIDGPDPRREMLRALLVDRFKLSSHGETREGPVYALVRAQPDGPVHPRLHPSSVDCAALLAGLRRNPNPGPPPATSDGIAECSIRTPPGGLIFGTQPMRQLAAILSQIVQRPVVDRTGLSGNYSAMVTYSPDSATGDSNSVSIFTALQEQLGLKLESTRGPLDVLVIDHIERPAED